MLDITKQEIKVGDYIAYAKTNGRSARLAVYHVRGVTASGIKAHQLYRDVDRYVKYEYVDGKYQKVAMSDKEREKINNKTVILSQGTQAIILHGFDPVAHRFN